MASDASRVTFCTRSMCSGSSPRISLIGEYSRSLRMRPSARSTLFEWPTRSARGSMALMQSSARWIE